MGGRCCKDSSSYVRQRDIEGQNGLVVNNSLANRNDRVNEFPRSESQIRPSEDSTKGSETELAGGYPYTDDVYQHDRPVKESSLRRRLGRFRFRQRPPDGQLSKTYRKQRSHGRTDNEWKMSPEAVYTGGHQEIKNGKCKGKTKNGKKVNNPEEKEDGQYNDQPSSSAGIPLESNDINKIDTDPYSVRYSPIIKEGLPAPPSSSESEGDQRFREFRLHRRRRYHDQQTEMTTFVAPQEGGDFGRAPPPAFTSQVSDHKAIKDSSSDNRSILSSSLPSPPPFEDDIIHTPRIDHPNTLMNRNQFQSNVSTNAPFDSTSTDTSN